MLKTKFVRWDDGVEEFNLDAMINGTLIGRVMCEITDNRIYICELHVNEGFRGNGIGRELLHRVLVAADSKRAQVWGDVVQKDIDAQPHLLAWYMKLGFEIVDPDAECIAGTAKKIVRQPRA